MKLITVILVLLTNSMFAVSSIFFKLAISRIGDSKFSSLQGSLQAFGRLLSSSLFYSGVVTGLIGSICYYLMLSRMNLSIAYPLLSLAYLFVALGCIVFLKESIGVLTWIGMVLIVAGVAVISVKA
jgi:undecaprenyl phosphate-alpha-L-ara4N flippase subunit ArnE